MNAGDPDREGQLLIDEMLDYLGNTKPVERILLNALDEKSMRYALEHMQDNKKYQPLKDSALARSRADLVDGDEFISGLYVRATAFRKQSDLSDWSCENTNFGTGGTERT